MRSQPEWKRYGYSSLEAFIEAKAGASPPNLEQRQYKDWPMPMPPPYEADDEDKEQPDA